MYFVTFGSYNPTIGSHWLTHTIKIIVSLLLAHTVCTHSHALLLLVQLHKLVTTAHVQTAISKDACWKHNFCQFEQGMSHILALQAFKCSPNIVFSFIGIFTKLRNSTEAASLPVWVSLKTGRSAQPAAAAAGMTMGQSLLEELFPECKTKIMCRLVVVPQID